MIISSSATTRSVEDEETIVLDIIESSIDFLNKNGISYEDFCTDRNDPRIAIIAMGITEYVISQTPESRTTFGGCLLQSLAFRSLGEQSTKQLAREIGKAVLKKAVPYVGWGFFAIEMAMCLIE